MSPRPARRPTGMTTAERFLDDLRALATPEQQVAVQRYFRTGPGEYGHGDVFLGVRMGQVFALAERYRWRARCTRPGRAR
jgi:hypothetical protein